MKKLPPVCREHAMWRLYDALIEGEDMLRQMSKTKDGAPLKDLLRAMDKMRKGASGVR